MRKLNKNLILFTLMFLVIGFATITTTLFINGGATVSENREGCDTVFESAVLDGVDITNTAITNNGHTLTFDTPVLKTQGDKSKIDFTMKAKYAYDAEIDVECTTTNLENVKLEKSIPELIYRNSTEKGYINVELKHQVTDDVTGKITCELKSKCVNTTKLHIYIDPNGGEYNGTKEMTIYTHEDGESEILDTDKLSYSSDLKFVGWYDENNNRVDIDEEGNILNQKDLVLNGEDITVTAKWEQLVPDEVAVARIKETGVNYATIQAAIDKATNGQNILLLKSTTENPTNNKIVTLDLDGNTVTGTITNESELTIVNESTSKTGKIENNESYAIYNKGTFILGKNDAVVNTYGDEVTVAIIGNTYGLYKDDDQTTTFKFYDGYIQADKWGLGGVQDKPNSYYPIVEYDENTGKQIACLTDGLTDAVAEHIGIYYVNLNNAFQVAGEIDDDSVVNAIRDFEAAYALYNGEDRVVNFNISGFDIKTGNTITNDGILNIIDSATENGKLTNSMTITNNNELSIKNSILTTSTNVDLITNNKKSKVLNSNISATSGCAFKNNTGGTLEMNSNTTIKANSYGLCNTSTTNVNFASGNIYGFNNTGVATIENGKYYNNGSNYVIANSNNLTINNIDLTATSTGIQSSATLHVLNGVYKTGSTGFYLNGGTATLENGELTSGGVAINTATSNAAVIVKDGSYTSTSSNGIHGKGTVTVSGGNITSLTGQGISNTQTLNISGGTIKGKTNGVNHTCEHHSYRYFCVNLGNMVISGGNITGENNYGVTIDAGTNDITGGNIVGGVYGLYSFNSMDNTPTTNIGKLDNTIDPSSPSIRGGAYGFYRTAGTINFYDGILKGVTGGYYGDIARTPDASIIHEGTEIIDEIEYITKSIQEQPKFVRVAGVDYNSLNKAIEAITTTGTMTLINSAETKAEVVIPSEKTITWDLNGYTFTTSQPITNNGTLTIEDNSTEKSGKIESSYTSNAITSSKSITLNSGTLKSTNGSVSTLYVSAGSLILNGGNIESANTGISSSGGSIELNYVDVNSNGTCMSIASSGTVYDANLVCGGTGFSTSGTVTIEDITINASGNAVSNDGSLTIEGGTYTSSGNAITGGGTINLKAGTVTSTSNSGVYATGTLNLSGGTITGKT